MKIFIDAGFYIGRALDYYAPFLDDTWTVFAFEPNPTLDVESMLKRFPFEVKLINKAVWIKDGNVHFRLQSRTDAAHIDTIRPSIDKRITVPAIDFSRFIKELPEAETIVCSMDIEGAEFPVLRKMINEKTIRRISVLDVEFHHRFLSTETVETVSLLRRELESEGVLVKLKLEV